MIARETQPADRMRWVDGKYLYINAHFSSSSVTFRNVLVEAALRELRQRGACVTREDAAEHTRADTPPSPARRQVRLRGQELHWPMLSGRRRCLYLLSRLPHHGLPTLQAGRGHGLGFLGLQAVLLLRQRRNPESGCGHECRRLAARHLASVPHIPCGVRAERVCQEAAARVHTRGAAHLPPRIECPPRRLAPSLPLRGGGRPQPDPRTPPGERRRADRERQVPATLFDRGCNPM